VRGDRALKAQPPARRGLSRQVLRGREAELRYNDRMKYYPLFMDLAGRPCLVVGAGAVVTKDVPPRTVVVGSPARVLRQVPDDELLENA